MNAGDYKNYMRRIGILLLIVGSLDLLQFVVFLHHPENNLLRIFADILSLMAGASLVNRYRRVP
jgi:hypothetical protein